MIVMILIMIEDHIEIAGPLKEEGPKVIMEDHLREDTTQVEEIMGRDYTSQNGGPSDGGGPPDGQGPPDGEGSSDDGGPPNNGRPLGGGGHPRHPGG